MSAEMVIDTSVVFKWFSPTDEPGTPEALGLLDAHAAGDLKLIAPSTLPVELANGLRYVPLDGSAVKRALTALELAHIRTFDCTGGLLASAVELAVDHDITVYDALFLALALERTCILATADRRAFSNMRLPVDVRLL